MTLTSDQWKLEYDQDSSYFELLSSWHSSGRFRRRTAPIIAMLRPHLPPGGRVLDAGCAAGAMSIDLARAGVGRVDAVDFSSTALRHARANAERHGVGHAIRFVEGTLEQLGVADDSYDVVVAADVIEHIVRPETFLREMLRVCRPGGVLLVETPNTLFRQHPWYPRIEALCRAAGLPESRSLFPVEGDRDYGRYHISLLAWAELVALMRASGWQIVAERPFGWWMRPGAADTAMALLARGAALAGSPMRYYGASDVVILARKPARRAGSL